MKRTIIAAICVMSVGCAVAAENGPQRAFADHSKVIMEASNKQFTFVTGGNFLDKSHTFKCASISGCLIGFAPSLQTNGGQAGVYLCLYVDGVPAGKPRCGASESSEESIVGAKQHAVVGQGQHTLQAFVHSDNNNGTALGWEIDYTIYELKPRDAGDD